MSPAAPLFPASLPMLLAAMGGPGPQVMRGFLAGGLVVALTVLALVALARTADLVTSVLLRMYYSCPFCQQRELPWFHCSFCDTRIDSLRPSLAGVLRRPCPRCGRLLPTLDMLGRWRLRKGCTNPDCRGDLDNQRWAVARSTTSPFGGPSRAVKVT